MKLTFTFLFLFISTLTFAQKVKQFDKIRFNGDKSQLANGIITWNEEKITIKIIGGTERIFDVWESKWMTTDKGINYKMYTGLINKELLHIGITTDVAVLIDSEGNIITFFFKTE